MSFIQQFFTSRDNNANAETFVGQQDRLWWDPVTNKIYASDGVTPGGIPVGGGGGGNGEPGGSNTMVQFNNSGSFGGSSNFTYNNSTGVLTIAGNVSAGNFIGDGSQLTNLPATYSNTNVAAYLPTYTGNLVALTGNVTTTANISGNYILGNGSQLTGLPATYSNSNVTTLLANFGSNTISTTGNITAGNFIGTVANAGYADNSAHATVADSANSVSGANVSGSVEQSNYANTANSVSGSNVTGNVGNAVHSYFSDVANSVSGSNVSGQVANALVSGTVYSSAQPNITSVGNLTSVTSTGNIVTTGNIVGAYLYGDGSNITGLPGGLYGNADVSNYLASGTDTANIITTGNISGNYFIGNGSLLTGIATSTYGNTDVSAYLASGTDTANIITTGNISGANILGNLFGTNATLTANTTSGNVFANNVQIGGPGGSGLAWDPAFKVLTFPTDSSFAPAMVATMGTFTQYVNAIWSPSLIGYKFISNGMATAYTQNIGSGSHTWTVYQTGVAGSNLGTVSSNTLSYSYGNLWSQGNITATSNVSGTYIIGNGSALTNLTGANVTGTVANATYATSAGSATSATTAGTVTTAAQPNITSVGTLSSLSVTGNVTSSANISGSYILGNGSALTSLTGANVTGTVANATYATTAGSTTQLVNGSYSLVLNSNGTMAVPGNLINTGSSPVGFWSTDTVTSYWRSPTGGGAGLPFQSTTAMSNTGVVLTFLTGVANTLVAKSWTFGFNGNLTFPDSTIQSTAFTGTATTAGTVTTNAQPNITSVGTLSSLLVTGNITSVSGLLIGNGSALTSLTGANVTGTVANATYATTAGSATTAGTVTTAAQPNITSVGTLSSLTVTANTTSGNLITGGLISATGNITGGNVASNGKLDVAGNITGGNISIGGLFTTPGNVAAGWVHGSYYTGSWGANFIAAGNITTAANISGDIILSTNSGNGTNFKVGDDAWIGDINVSDTVGIKGVQSNGANAYIVFGNSDASGKLGRAGTGPLTYAGQFSATGTITSNGATNSTAFAVGNSAVSNVALGLFPTAGTAGEYAIRDYSTVPTNMYFDVAIGNTGTGGNFVFRGSSSYTTYATINNTGLNMNSRAIQGQTPYISKTAWNSALDTVITVDALQFRINSGVGIFPQVQAVSGSVNLAWTAVAAISGAAIAQTGSTGSIISTWGSLYTAHGMDAAGDTITVTLQDKGNGKIYRVTFVRSDNGSTTGYNIIAERLL